MGRSVAHAGADYSGAEGDGDKAGGGDDDDDGEDDGVDYCEW